MMNHEAMSRDVVQSRRFAQVDVFASQPVSGNPVAVVVDADGISDEQMAAFARWTNLSETTFLLPPTDPDADYRLRIFTPGSEMPFAGHPTLGSAHAWLAAGGVAAGDDIVQECGVGLVRIRRTDGRLAFAAPPLSRSGPVADDTRAEVTAALGVDPQHVLAAEWVINGPRWMVLQLDSAQRVLEVTPDFAALGDHEVGLVGAHTEATAPDTDVMFEVRAFAPGDGIPEDPVTGSLNAGIAMWLRGAGLAPSSYVAAQGTVLGRSGRVHVTDDGENIWIGGESTTVITGSVDL
ncbi:PhzF family phenazine biosynthesis protein [Gordonia polyisoprenivorans]|uniref:PhzF family phenazine biosynthesis protein n=1 Tax=Gordonia polyisoprenivorans TaxID=84595 RepID=A0A846WVF6_9ACTN|nr:PhzF family phenazine biosynthesis protein [Gordonia polyisoprenivorans]NKY04720.1 PhzF family phenazine biosynthesis protein [Gordonia polyisoprenivorans]